MTFGISRRGVLGAAALLPGLAAWPTLAGAPAAGFTHSVASGDPKQDRVMLWTRYVPADGGSADLRVEVAEDEGFRRVVVRTHALAGPLSDHTAKVEARGLRPGRFYYYRFAAPGGARSPVGRTRTLPTGGVDRARIAIFSCANATSGWFNAYAHAAARDDIDLVLHLGDYIYESPTDRSDALAALAKARDVQPLGETVSLADYRLRYASYRADPGLLELHRRFPMIAIWDDHEVANNAWKGGASGHHADDGPWPARVAAGMRAWHEWMPMGAADYDRYEIGDLATLFRVETRLRARSGPLDVLAALGGGGDLKAKALAFRDGALADPARTMMGADQEAWLAGGFRRSAAAGTRWQLLAQQVIMAPSHLAVVRGAWFAPGVVPTAQQQARIQAVTALGKLGVSTELDRWDGFPAARSRLLAAAAQARAELVVLSGDSHNAWAYDLRHEGAPVAVEFAGHSVSSLGLDKAFGGDPATIARDLLAADANLRWCDTSRRGYMVADVTPSAVSNEWLFLPGRAVRSTEVLDTRRLAVERGARRLVAA